MGGEGKLSPRTVARVDEADATAGDARCSCPDIAVDAEKGDVRVVSRSFFLAGKRLRTYSWIG